MTVFVDGERREWHLIEIKQGARRVASASFRQRPHGAELVLHGYPEPRFSSRGALAIEVRYRGVFEPGDDPIGLDILYQPEGMRGPLWTSNDAPEAPKIEIVEFDVWGEAGELEAVFSGQICLREFIFSPTDISRCMALSGQVSTRLTAR